MRFICTFCTICTLLAGCQTTSGSFCTIAPKLYFRQQVYDAMSDREAARMLGYLKTGEELCGWKKP